MTHVHGVCYEVAKEAVDSVTENHHDEVVKKTKHRKNARLRDEYLVECIPWDGDFVRQLNIVFFVGRARSSFAQIDLDEFRCV